MLSEVKKKLEGPKFNIDFGVRGWGRQGKGIRISTMQKGAILRKCVNTFVPHCRFTEEHLVGCDNVTSTQGRFCVQRFLVKIRVCGGCSVLIAGSKTSLSSILFCIYSPYILK